MLNSLAAATSITLRLEVKSMASNSQQFLGNSLSDERTFGLISLHRVDDRKTILIHYGSFETQFLKKMLATAMVHRLTGRLPAKAISFFS